MFACFERNRGTKFRNCNICAKPKFSAEVLFDYEPERKDSEHISLKAGEVLNILESEGDSWIGITPKGKKCRIKKNYVTSRGPRTSESLRMTRQISSISARGLLFNSQLDLKISNESESEEIATPINMAGYAPIHIACQYNFISIIKHLIKVKTCVNKMCTSGATPLKISCENGSLAIVRLLLLEKANPGIAMEDGTTPLYMACQNGHWAIVKELIMSKTRFNRTDENGCSPLYVSCQKGYCNVVNELLESKAKLEEAYLGCYTPLYIACRSGHVPIVEALLNAKADFNKSPINGATPLKIACEKGHREIVTQLVYAKADIKQPSKNKGTAFSVAVYLGHNDIVKELIKAKINVNEMVNTPDSFSFSINLEIISANNVPIMDKNGLCDPYVKVTYENIMGKAITEQTSIKNKTLCPIWEESLKLTDIPSDGRIEISLWDKDILDSEIIGISTIDMGAFSSYELKKPYVTDGNFILQTEFSRPSDIMKQVTIKYKHEIIKEVSQQNNKILPLSMASQLGHTEIAVNLLDLKSDVTITDQNGYTPLCYACKYGHTEIAALLISSRSDLTTATKDNKTPLTLAKKWKHDKIIRLLEDQLNSNRSSPKTMGLGTKKISKIFSKASAGEAMQRGGSWHSSLRQSMRSKPARIISVRRSFSAPGLITLENRESETL